MTKLRAVTLREQRTKDDTSILVARIDDKGNLMLDGYDIGKAPKEFWGDSDYEYWRIIDKSYKNKIILELSKERFGDKLGFAAWLREKVIPHRFWRLIGIDYKDTVLLWLIKERFDSDTDFADWLEEKGIPSQFGSWIETQHNDS